MMKSATARSARQSGYLPSLDGWRAVAILWVMQAHGPAWTVWGVSNRWINLHGERGVQLFFALSGVLICTLLLREERRSGSISLRGFYARRFFRIQPAALAYLGVVALLMAAGAVPQGWAGVAASVGMVRNLVPKVGGSWETNHFWSLAAEEHFYLLLPGLLLVCRRCRLALMLSLVVAFELWRIFVFNHPSLQGFTWQIDLRTDMVLGGILLGCAFALALDDPRVLAAAKASLRPWVALLYAATIFTATTLHQSTFNHALIITVYPVLIVATMLHPESVTTRFLELAPVRFVGRISYSLYLWQMLFLNPYLHHEPHSFHMNALMGYAASFACAVASYSLVETPLIRWGHSITGRRVARFERGLAAAD